LKLKSYAGAAFPTYFNAFLHCEIEEFCSPDNVPENNRTPWAKIQVAGHEYEVSPFGRSGLPESLTSFNKTRDFIQSNRAVLGLYGSKILFLGEATFALLDASNETAEPGIYSDAGILPSLVHYVNMGSAPPPAGLGWLCGVGGVGMRA